MPVTREVVLANFHHYKDKIVQMQRFVWWFKLLCLLPTILWFAEFNLSKFIPKSIRPTVNTTTLPHLDSRLLLGYSLLHWPRNALETAGGYNGLINFFDMLSAFVYIIHFCFAWIFAFGIYMYYRKKTDATGRPLLTPWSFFWCLGLLNFTAVTLQLIWATAPPWYVEYYGTSSPSYDMHGDPAGLLNADKLLGFALFSRIYGNSPIVFGSFPSLHGAWPIMITIFAPQGKGYKAAGIIYTSLVWWAAMYLNHHFLTDLLGGLLFVAANYFGGMALLRLIMNHFKDRIYGPAANLSKLSSSYGDAPGLELIVVQDENVRTSDENLLRPSRSSDELLRTPKMLASMKKIPSRDDNFIPLLDEASLKSVSENAFKNEKHL
eukprot:TRINITY_DN732_c0_g2_i1.p1 TRINITY_DN732_c0_g2~~TRINITY_DN732_c0_g2_i1.p1  ORF type:complete len:378 (-),score=60.53 TRINITY_DN732_c0_g2_i1:19-1152(-)